MPKFEKVKLNAHFAWWNFGKWWTSNVKYHIKIKIASKPLKILACISEESRAISSKRLKLDAVVSNGSPIIGFVTYATTSPPISKVKSIGKWLCCRLRFKLSDYCNCYYHFSWLLDLISRCCEIYIAVDFEKRQVL